MRAIKARWSVAPRRAVALLLGLVASAACTTATPTRYKTLSEDWRRSEAQARAGDAEDDLFAGAPFLVRRELIRHVLERNPNVRAARYAWRAALARYPQVTSLDDPMLAAGIAPRSIGSSKVDNAAQFGLSQKLPFPGKLRLRGEAALGEAAAAAHDHEAVRLRLATMASLLFDDYYVAIRSIEINREHIALLEEFRQIAAVRYEAGEASQQDPIQAEVELTHALHRALLLETARRVNTEQINALLHRRPDRALPPPPTRLLLPDAPLQPSEQLTEEALQVRPELAAADARVAAQEARVGLAWREYLPDFTVVGAYNGIHQESDLKPFVGIQLNVPLRLGRRKAAVAEATARLEQARSLRLAIEDDVRLGVESAADRLVEADHVSKLFRDRLRPAARDQVDAARAGFETGRNSFLALIDAERNLLSVELGYEKALASLGQRRAELDQELGHLPGLSW